MRVLLVEPAYKNKYPPLGLMKIATFHKHQGDLVTFVKGLDKGIQNQVWDRIYITSLFSFYWTLTIDTIIYYEFSVLDPQNLYIGGPMATILADDIEKETGFKVVKGLLNESGKLNMPSDDTIDNLVPDYDILDDINYVYPAKDAYFTYMTRGCIRKCEFCAVPIIEPDYSSFVSIKKQIDSVDALYGKKSSLLLMDNNVLASEQFDRIIDEIKDMGFYKGASYIPDSPFEVLCNKLRSNPHVDVVTQSIYKFLHRFPEERLSRYQEALKYYNQLLDNFQLRDLDDGFASRLLSAKHEISPLIEKYRNKSKKQRVVDFNQGVDARLATDENMKKLAEINIKPLRIAYDHIKLTEIYSSAVKLAAKYGMTDLSNYILFNYNDKPDDFYYRLENNIKLNVKYGVKIFSFPMKYIPVTDKSRGDYVGTHWNKKYIRSIQSVLNVTKGSVSPGESFFYKAFGKNIDEFHKIMIMPEQYIMQRFASEDAGLTDKWWNEYISLDNGSKETVDKILYNNDVITALKSNQKYSHQIRKFFSHYIKATVS